MPTDLDERKYYDGHFAELHRRLDAIRDELSNLRADNATKHANDARIAAIIDGNGHAPLAVRIDRLEQAGPTNEKRSTRVMSIVALVLSAMLVAIDALAAIFRK